MGTLSRASCLAAEFRVQKAASRQEQQWAIVRVGFRARRHRLKSAHAPSYTVLNELPRSGCAHLRLGWMRCSWAARTFSGPYCKCGLIWARVAILAIFC